MQAMVATDTDDRNARLASEGAGFARQTDPAVAADMGPRPGLGA